MKKLIDFNANIDKTSLVRRYLRSDLNGLRDLIFSMEPEKVFVQRQFVERWKSLRESKLQSLGVAERLLVSLIINDLILRLDLLEKAVRAISAISLEQYIDAGLITLELEDSSVINILLSEATCRLIGKHHDDLSGLKIDVKKTLSNIDKWFWGEGSGESFVGGYALFIKQYLPPLIFASIVGYIDYTCLDKKVLDRAYRTNGTPTIEPDEINELQTEELRGSGSDTSRWWIAQQLLNWLKEHVKGVISRNALLHQIDTSLAPSAVEDTIAHLYADWVRYLITFGSRHKSTLKPSTVDQYARLLFRYLFESIDPQLTIQEFITHYIESPDIPILSDIAGSSAQQLNAALEVFKTYLVEVHRVETDMAKMPGYDVMIEAEIVWPSEIVEAVRQARSIPDRTLSINCSIAFVLSTLVRLRISELLALQIRDFQISMLEAAVLLTIRASKSEAGVRTVRVPLEQAELIVEFLTYRIQVDKAHEQSSIWGNYETDKVYRQSAFVAQLNGILKLAAGDLAARFHWLSHSKATSEFWQLFSGHSRYLPQPNPVFALAADLGHLSYHTSWSTYTHCVDHLIAQAARNLWGSIPREFLPSWDFRLWLSCTSLNTYKSTVRRGKSRGVSTGQSHSRLVYGKEPTRTSPPFCQGAIQFPSFQEIWPDKKTIVGLTVLDIFNLVCLLTRVDGVDRANLIQQFGIDREIFDRLYWVLGQYGLLESASAWSPDVLRYSSCLEKAFCSGFRNTTKSMISALNAAGFNPKEDYFYLREIIKSKNLALPLHDPRFKKLVEFLKASQVDPEQCSFEVGVLVPGSDSDQLINLFKYTYLRMPRVSYCKGSGRRQIRLHIFKSELRSTSTAIKSEKESLVRGVASKRSRPGNRAAIGVCIQAVLFCQVVVWDLRQRGGL